ncbi:lysophospholipid acyltransferase family protein [Campylobacter mucosalis]|uniref:Lysophospholipid acyltransferase n=1 Tax=Campylobacter mucosalis CCUG 21559 TaxID=1032067 RepID=A0A6G5QJB2_9BACT|nr:lysophospholipid acyltransferase family protein [Campylobacter mucosalis]QCD45709.1 lysophospholipid acyltransferase [Campylobacter mucosalis CCUG 21559]
MQLLRITRVAFLYSSFGLICLFGDLLFMPIVVFGLNKFELVKRFCRELVRLSWGFFIWLCKVSGYLKVEFNASNLGKSGEIIIANHPSLLDVVFFLSSVKNLNCVVKGELGKNIFLAFAIKACGYISNENNEKLLEQSLNALKNGESLLIFPEGTRTKDEIVFHKAPFFIAIKAAKILTPVVIDMKPRSLRKDESWFSVPSECISYKFKTTTSLNLSDFLANRPDPIRVRLLQDEILKIYKELR